MQASFICECNIGYERDGFNCVNIDEYDIDTDGCYVDGFCTDTDGSFVCDCNVGYFRDGFNCTNIDECVVDEPCDDDGTCTDNPGTFECDCDIQVKWIREKWV